MRRSLLLGGLVAVTGFVGACESLIGADFGADRPGVCDPVTPPIRLDGGDTAGAHGLTAVIYSIDWGDTDNDAGQPASYSIGYNLDGRCTSLFDSPACEPAPWTGATIVDGPHGIDNATGLMLHDQQEKTVFGVDEFSSAFFNANIMDGSQAPPAMFRVSGYSGLAYDDEVTVEWFVPAAVSAKAGAPDFDTSPMFAISQGTADVLDGGAGLVSRYIDLHGYVSGYQLVAHFSGAPIGISNVPIKTVDAVVTAALVPAQGKEWQMSDGIVAGHLRVSELFDDMALLSTTIAGGAEVTVCRNTSFAYANIKRWLCSHTDSLIDAGSGQPCDGLSFGAAFVARGAQVGPVAPSPPTPVLCATGENPAGDTCATAPN